MVAVAGAQPPRMLKSGAQYRCSSRGHEAASIWSARRRWSGPGRAGAAPWPTRRGPRRPAGNYESPSRRAVTGGRDPLAPVRSGVIAAEATPCAAGSRSGHRYQPFLLQPHQIGHERVCGYVRLACQLRQCRGRLLVESEQQRAASRRVSIPAPCRQPLVDGTQLFPARKHAQRAGDLVERIAVFGMPERFARVRRPAVWRNGTPGGASCQQERQQHEWRGHHEIRRSHAAYACTKPA